MLPKILADANQPLGPVFQNDPTGLIHLDWIKS